MHPHTYTRALNRRHTLHGAIPVPPPLRKIIISRTSPHGHNGWSPPLQWLLLLLLLLLKFHRHLVHGRRRLLGHGDMHSVNRKNFMPRNIIYYINARPRKKIKNVFIFILCSCIFLIFFFWLCFTCGWHPTIVLLVYLACVWVWYTVVHVPGHTLYNVR